MYLARNDHGDYAERAALILTQKKFDKKTDAYKAYSSGNLPPAHIHAMARRYAVKLFLSHLHGEMHRPILASSRHRPIRLAICSTHI